MSPQEIQKKYKDYEKLIKSVEEVNKNLILYADELKKFSHEEPPTLPTKIITKFKDAVDNLDYSESEDKNNN